MTVFPFDALLFASLILFVPVISTLSMAMRMWFLSALLLSFLIHLILFLMLILLLVEALPSPSSNNETRLLLPHQDNGTVGLLTNVLVLLGPLAVHLAVKVGAELVFNLLLLQDSFDQSFENINVVYLLGGVRVHLDLQILQQFEGFYFFHDDALLVVDKVAILLTAACILFALRVILGIVILGET